MVGLRPGFTFVYLERTDMETQIGCQENLVLGQCQTDLELSNGGVMAPRYHYHKTSASFHQLPVNTGRASALCFAPKQGHRGTR